MDNVKSPNMLFSVNDDTSTTHVAAPSNHDNVARVELDKVSDFILLQVKLDCIVDTDERIRIADRATIVGDNMRDATVADSDAANFEELVFGFLRCDAMDGEPALNIVEETEMFTRLFNGDNIHETRRVGWVRADLVVDFDKALVDD